MAHLFNIDELEQEISYLREQNQKLIKELSRTVQENIALREELSFERQQRSQPSHNAPKNEHRKKAQPAGPQGGGKGGMLCLH
jgi:regulator of replication initiation timing